MKERHTFSKFTSGIDRRYIESESESNDFEDLLNCSVSSMNRIVKRGGIKLSAEMTEDTVGLFGFNGRLWTIFSGNAGETPTTQPQPIGDNEPELWVIDLQHSHTKIHRVHFVGVLLGGLYISVEYTDFIPGVDPSTPTGPGVNIVENFYVVTDAEVWSENKKFAADPAGFRVIPTDAVNNTTKILTLGLFYEAKDLGRATVGSPQPVWPVNTDNPNTVDDGEIKWKAVELLARDTSVAENVTYNADGVYCIPTSKQTDTASWRVWYAINIPDVGTTLKGAEDTIFDSTVGSFTTDGEILWECLQCRQWAAGATYEISWPEDPDANNTQFGHTLTSDNNEYGNIYVGSRIKVETGITEPDPWNTTIGGSTTDGEITWETKTTKVTDKKCPNGTEIVLHQSKVYSIGSTLKIVVPSTETDPNIDSVLESDLVRFSATADPFDWSAEEDAGFIATGVHATGSEIAKALGKYDNQVAVLMEDNIQVWAVDPDPQRNALARIIGDIGTSVSGSVVNIGTDLLFLSPGGFRSMGQMQSTDRLQDTDVGSPIDDIITQRVRDAVNPSHIIATNYPIKGQMWCAIGNEIWVWTWSRNSKVSAWARYTLADEIDYFAPLGGKLYMRGHTDRLLLIDEDDKTDYTGDYTMRLEFAFQSLKSIGVMKQVQAVDVLANGTADLSFRYDGNNPSEQTKPVKITGSTRSGQLIPVELCATEIAPVLEYTGPDDLEISAVTLYFNNLGLV